MQKTGRDPIYIRIQSEKGASSVLVVLVLIVLVALGLAALTTALASMRLGEKSAEWYAAYFELDKAAEKKIAVIDRSITEAREQADAYMSSRLYLEDVRDMPEELQSRIRDIASQAGGLTEEQRKHIRNTVYYFYLGRAVSEKGIDFIDSDLETGTLILNLLSGHLPAAEFVEGELSGSGMTLEVRLEIKSIDHEDRFSITRWAVNND